MAKDSKMRGAETKSTKRAVKKAEGPKPRDDSAMDRKAKMADRKRVRDT